ncbi:hypothetical protein ABZX40_37890 [Streptomyces sp. NPDC004610]|uniref:hypothetical protein n=1 Tax=unclassified Streptomyces TaxID=2593676 RepID=UPI0033AA55D6
MTDQPKVERSTCPDCEAGPGRDNACISAVMTDGRVTEIWHTTECPAYILQRINWEESARQVKEQDAWAQGVFPAAHERLKQAAAAAPPGSPARPFVDALSELVQAQADTTGFVDLPEWATILERHFPPELPDPGPTG